MQEVAWGRVIMSGYVGLDRGVYLDALSGYVRLDRGGVYLGFVDLALVRYNVVG